MRKNHLGLLLIILLISASCSSIKHYRFDDAYKSALKQSFTEGNDLIKVESKRSGRVLASKGVHLKAINFDLNKLRSFQVLTFPKISTISHKNSINDFDLSEVNGLTEQQKIEFYDSLQHYGRPVIYEFHAVELQSCYKMIKNRPKHKPEKFFGNANFFSLDKSKKCLILEAKKRPLVSRANLKRDDIIALRMYFDEDLRPYGKSIDYYSKEAKNKSRTVDYRYQQNQSMSSELSEYPVDFPNFSVTSIAKNWKISTKKTLNIPDHNYVVKKINRLVSAEKCQSGYQTNYKDLFGNPVKIGWCQGHSWPTTVHTNRFFSIVKRIK
jgi:hypothetical protein